RLLERRTICPPDPGDNLSPARAGRQSVGAIAPSFCPRGRGQNLDLRDGRAPRRLIVAEYGAGKLADERWPHDRAVGLTEHPASRLGALGPEAHIEDVGNCGRHGPPWLASSERPRWICWHSFLPQVARSSRRLRCSPARCLPFVDGPRTVLRT